MSRELDVVIRYAAERDEGLLKAFKGYLKDLGEDWGYILPDEAKKIGKGLSEKYFIVDLRDADSFKEGHIPGAMNLYWKDILDRKNFDRLPKDKKILLVCYLGHTASQVMVILRMLGYDATVLKFGMGKPPKKGVEVAGWLARGYETSKD